MSRASFVKTLFKDIMVGAVTPTSSFAVKNVCRKIDPAKARVIVEYGPGTGVFTQFLLDTIPDEKQGAPKMPEVVDLEGF